MLLRRMCVLLIILGSTQCSAVGKSDTKHDKMVTLLAEESFFSCCSQPAQIEIPEALYDKYKTTFNSLPKEFIAKHTIRLGCAPMQLQLIAESLEMLEAENAKPPLRAIERLIRLFHDHGQDHSTESNEALCNGFLLPVLQKYPSIFNKTHQDYTLTIALLNRINEDLDTRGSRKGKKICAVGATASALVYFLPSEAAPIICAAGMLMSGCMSLATLTPTVQWESRPIVYRIWSILNGSKTDFSKLPGN